MQIEKTDSLFESVHKGDFCKVVAFIEVKKENLNLANRQGQTALHLASQNGSCEITEYLLKKRAKIDAQDEDGKTSLYCASQWGQEKIVQLLLERGAKRK